MAVSELPGNPNAVWTVKKHSDGEILKEKNKITKMKCLQDTHKLWVKYMVAKNAIIFWVHSALTAKLIVISTT